MPPARRVVGGSFRIPRSVLPATGRGKARLATQKSPRSGAFKEGALRGPAQPPSLHANTQRQGPMVVWIQKVRSGSKTYLLNPKQKLLDSKATQGIEPKIEPVTEALTRRNAVPNAAPPASPDVCLTPLARTRYRFCPLLRCAGHSWPSDQRQETGHANKCSASQPPASRRSIGARWPEERSALEMAYSGGDRSHTKGHA